MTVHELHPETPPAWWSEALDFLAEAGPISVEELAESIGQDESDVRELLVESRAAYPAFSGWVNVLALADRAAFTHVVTAEELAAGELTVNADLALLELLAGDEGLPLDDGGELRAFCRHGEPVDAHVLSGPAGWLARFKPDDLVALRVVDGAVAVSPAELPSPLPWELAEQSKEVLDWFHYAAENALLLFAAVPEEDRATPGVAVEDAVVDILMMQAELLADPLPPLSEILRGSERLEIVDGEVGLAAAPWDPRQAEGLDRQAVLDLTMAREWLRSSGAEPRHSPREVLEALAKSPVLLLRVADDVERDAVEPGRLDELRRTASGLGEQAAAALLVARQAEREGRADDAAGLVEEALQQVPDLAPALSDAAEYAATRGDVARADELLARAGLPSNELPRSLLRQLSTLPMGSVARNQPCPCGSGLKYKKCCLPNEPHPLPLRAQLLHHLLLAYAARPGHRELVQSLQMLSVPEADSACTDLVLFGLGIAERFLRHRGGWLREDERDLLSGWVRAPLRLYEVESVSPGREAVVRALPDGEPVVLRDRIFSEGARPLDLVLARLMHDGARLALFANHFAVHRMRRAELLRLLASDPDAFDIAAFFGPQPAPEVRNRDGHELVQCEATYEVTDDSAWDRLAAGLSADGPDRLVAQDDRAIKGSVRRDGVRWIVEADSLERLRELQALVTTAAPDARHISESSVPLADAVDDTGPAEAPEMPAPAAEPELDELMERYIRDYEQRWVDEAIPALGGLSPREAAEQGGEALAELRALLDDLDWMHQRQDSAMSGERIREMLGIRRT